MAILSTSEFEAVLGHVMIRIDKALVERGQLASLETANRDLKQILAAARQPAKLKPLRGLLDKVTDTLGKEIPDDSAMLERLWDLADYLDYRV
jgi:hypothetical protein